MIKNKRNRIIVLIFMLLFIMVCPGISKAAKVSVGKVKSVKASSQNTSSIKISWKKVSKATGYRMYVYNESKKKYEYYGKTNKTSITMKKLKSAKGYKVKIRAYKTVKKKKYYGAYSSVLAATTKPTMVKNLKAKSQDTSSINLSWSKVTRATGYRVYVYNSSNKKYEYYGKTKKNSIELNKLKSSKEYKIKVRAYKDYDKKTYYGEYSSIFVTATKPNKVENVKIISQNDTSINLSWDKVTRATGYRVYIYNAGTNKYDYYGQTNTNSVTIANLVPAQEYKIKIRAYKESNKVKYYGSYAPVVTTITKPSKLQGFKVSDSDASSVKLSWQKIQGATGYKVYMYSSLTNKYDYYGKTSSSSITISNLDSKVQYKFKVRGYKTFNNVQYFGGYSPEIEKRTRKGIDVSKYQTDINWKKVKEDGVKFAVIRIGYRGYAPAGTLCEDKYFKDNITEAINNGIEVGVYFFSYAKDEKEAEEEAQWVINKLNEYNIDKSKIKFIAHDFETYNQNRVKGVSLNQINKNTKAFLKYVKNAKYTPTLYASKYYLTSIFKTDEILKEVSGCKIWLAHYTSATNYTGKYNMWQYSSKGSVKGISGNVDMNEVYF
ncbi:MAG: hypothetical protein HFJ17_01490 [Clostridia bacterium]|nr:hypothetical protein [Clostridia bacterium]